MRKKSLFIFLILFVSTIGLTQKELFYPELDSVILDYRAEGKALDSIDALVTTQPNLRPGGGFGTIYERDLANKLFLSPAGFSYLTSPKLVQPKFSGLPYLGFQYAFGSSLTQDMSVEYQHYFQENTHLHFRYNRSSSNGFLRNGDYKLNDLNLLFYHQKGFYAMNFDGYYGAYGVSQNGGIQNDSLLDNFGLEFIPIRRADANSKMRNLHLKLDNYFRLAGDSLINFGLKTKHQFKLIKREFFETFVDPTVFDTLYLDTNGNTRDQYQTVDFINGAGAYFTSPFFQIDATVNYNRWKNQNSAVYHDTNEVFLHSNLWASLGKRISLHNQFYFNFIGAIGELKDYLKIRYRILDNLYLSGKLNFENVYPEPYLRFHTANYLQWNIQDLKMQQKLLVGGTLKYGDTNFVMASVNWTSVNNGRYFINNEWRQDTLDFVSVGSVELKGAFRLKKWGFYPMITLRFGSQNFNYQPFFSTITRISYSSKLFKAKKLGLAVGVDVGYETGYQYLAYNELLDLYSPIQTTTKTPNLMQLNAFLALSIDQFRFFVRAENLSSLYQDPKARIDVNYPIMPLVIRVGITWDFFN